MVVGIRSRAWLVRRDRKFVGYVFFYKVVFGGKVKWVDVGISCFIVFFFR